MRRFWSAGAVVVAAALAQGAVASETTTYTYDELGRLVSSSNSGGPRNGKSALTSYDPAGNRASQAVGVPAPPLNDAAVFSISGPPAAVNEGSSATFVISKTGPSQSSLSVNYSTVNGTAGAPGDFAATSGTLTFRNWETVQTINIPTVADTSAEPLETFSVSLSAPSTGASLGTASASAQINASAGPNLPPVTAADAVSVKVCQFISKNVTANDYDPEGSALALVSVGSSTKADLWVETPSNIGVSAYGVTGSQAVSYVVRDAQGTTSTGSLTVTVTSGTGCN